MTRFLLADVLTFARPKLLTMLFFYFTRLSRLANSWFSGCLHILVRTELIRSRTISSSNVAMAGGCLSLRRGRDS